MKEIVRTNQDVFGLKIGEDRHGKLWRQTGNNELVHLKSYRFY